MHQSGGNRSRNQPSGRKPNWGARKGFPEEAGGVSNPGAVEAPIGWNIKPVHLEYSRVNHFDESIPSRSSYCRRERGHRLPTSGRVKQFQHLGPTSSLSSAVVYGAGLCRTEEVEVVLEAAPPQSLGGESRRRIGGYPANLFGFSLQPPSPQTRHDEPLTNFPLIANVIPGGPAFQSGVIQAGDSLLAIQGDSPLGKTIDKLTGRYLSPPTDTVNRHLALVTQYTVAENVIPSSGVFDVRIIKRSSSLGINLQADDS